MFVINAKNPDSHSLGELKTDWDEIKDLKEKEEKAEENKTTIEQELKNAKEEEENAYNDFEHAKYDFDTRIAAIPGAGGPVAEQLAAQTSEMSKANLLFDEPRDHLIFILGGVGELEFAVAAENNIYKYILINGNPGEANEEWLSDSTNQWPEVTKIIISSTYKIPSDVTFKNFPNLEKV